MFKKKIYIYIIDYNLFNQKSLQSIKKKKKFNQKYVFIV